MVYLSQRARLLRLCRSPSGHTAVNALVAKALKTAGDKNFTDVTVTLFGCVGIPFLARNRRRSG